MSEVDIRYKGTSIATMDASGTKTLLTSGKYCEDNIEIAYDQPSGGGGGTVAEQKQINFIDYDGTIVGSYTAAEWASVTALPDNPSHTGLTAQGWNWTKAQIDSQLSELPDGDIWVGQMYITDDGKTRIYIHLQPERLHPYLGICPNGTVEVDWGDGSSTDTLTGTALITVQYANHVYASAGDYVITLTVLDGSFAFYGTSSTSHLLKKGTSSSTNINRVYTSAVQKIEMGEGASIGNYAFTYCSLTCITIPSSVASIGKQAFNCCRSLACITVPNGVTSIGPNVVSGCNALASISIPSSVTDIGTYAFYYCYSLTSITIPNGLTNIGASAFAYCSGLASISMPNSVTSIGGSAFNGCESLVKVTIPNGVTSLASGVLSYCYSLASVTIPAGVTSIEGNAFSSCYGVAEYHILPTTPPTLANTNAFRYIQSECVMYVPSESLEAYKTASNWSNYASYMQGE